ncbi:unnamed protein product [Lepeophtheirus salmonis]|uniref:(salmon louse) hypothetical protein n=1 Tax=Lepeophtheirus salmonis TaxID=72036 RepID=A0A7R8D7B9_LEPSM|nr:unnamed protein product [Lepeophtheirus salmonis]CAF3047244.1 unnamed protein product [Lepeophtheirus salmonis]
MNNNKSKVKTSSDLSSHLNRKKRRKIMSSSSASSVVTKQEEPDVVEHTVIEEEEVVEESPGPKEVQYVVIDKTGETGGGRGVLSRQPSYCKILKDLKEVEEDVVMKGGEQQTETIEVTTSEAPVQTITINGQQYQIPPPTPTDKTVFIPGTLSNNSSSNNNSSSSQVMTVSPNASSHNSAAEDASRKREIRLLKNREAARECRNKKKEYIRCLEKPGGRT